MLGTAILSDCTTYSPPFCDATDVPVPVVPYSTITATYTVTTDFDGNIGKIDYAITSVQQYPFCLNTTLELFQVRFPFAVSYAVESWVVDSTSTATAVWSLSATNIVSGSTGVYKRPGTNQVLVTNVAWKANEYTYSLSSATGTSTDYAVVTNGYQIYDNCCSTTPSTQYFDTISPGGTVGRTPSAATTLYMRWVGASTSNVSGFNLTLTAAGSALAPWFVEVDAGQIVFTDKNGTTTSYSGTLTSVRTAINSWPTAVGRYFTAAIPENINSAATTADLKDYKSPPLSSTTCTTGLPIVLVGETLAPSSTGVTISNFAFNPADGFTDDKAGALLFITSTWFPKSSGFTSGQYYYISNELDVYLIPSSGVWSLTAGTSTHTSDYTLASVDSYYQTQTLVVARCNDSFDPCEEDIDPYCNGLDGVYTPSRPLDCNGNFYPADCGIYGRCWCQHFESTTTTLPQKTLTAVQVVRGSLKLS